jgi:hypothetical protein
MTLPPLSDATHRILFPYQRTACQQLVRALQHGQEEYGHAGCIDMSDVGVGKSFIDLAAALSTGKKVAVLTPLAGITNWLKTFKMFHAEPHYIGTPDGLKQGNRSHIASRHGNTFHWKHASDIALILDEGHQFKGTDSIASYLAEGAIEQGIPIICSSATLADSPVHLKVAGQVTGLHTGGPDFERFMVEYGCHYHEQEERWVWNKKAYLMEQLHHRIVPMRGCRVRKSDMGERPGQTIEVLPIECVEGPRIREEWIEGQRQIDEMQKKRYPFHVTNGIRRKIRMRLWQECEAILVPHVAELMKRDLEEGCSVLGFFSFTDSRLAMGKLMGTKDGFYGGQQPHERGQLESAFQSGRIRVLLSNTRAGGSAVSLHDLHGDRPRVTYLFPGDSATAMGQVPGRTDRAGMLSPSKVFIPVVKGTLSETMVRSTAKKQRAMAGLNDGAAS